VSQSDLADIHGAGLEQRSERVLPDESLPGRHRSDRQDPRAGHGRWVVARAAPPAIDPGKPSRPTRGAASVGEPVAAVGRWRPRCRPAPRWAGRRRTGRRETL